MTIEERLRAMELTHKDLRDKIRNIEDWINTFNMSVLNKERIKKLEEKVDMLHKPTIGPNTLIGGALLEKVNIIQKHAESMVDLLKEERDCDRCKYTGTKSCRYPCSECHDLMLNHWEPPK